MPVWYQQLAELRKSGDVKIVGLIQEQHADRCALFLQWKKMDIPILVDSLNRTGISAVPLLWAIDESGVVRKTRPDVKWFRETFVKTDYPKTEYDPKAALAESAAGTNVAHFLKGDWDAAINGGQAKLDADPSQAAAWFHWACACRARYDHGGGDVADFQNAVQGWSQALKLAPNNYIYRRRVQQYGPNMKKPYPFYNWVEQARKDIRARGEEPHKLIAEPRGAELATPSRSFVVGESSIEEPDPTDQITRDSSLVHAKTVVAPYPVIAGESVRVSVLLQPNAAQDVHWTNDAGTCTLVVRAGDLKVDQVIQQSAVPADTATSEETRQFDFEVLLPKSDIPDKVTAYVVYYVCSGAEGECVYRRQDVEISLPLGK